MNHERRRQFTGGYSRNMRSRGPLQSSGSRYFHKAGGAQPSWDTGPRSLGRGYNRGGREGFSPRGFGPRGSLPYNNRGGPRYNSEQSTLVREVMGRRLREDEIGVTEYISDLPGFTGVIKSRFSDFQVSEINLKGEVAKLTDLSVPQKSVKEEIAEDEELVSKYNLEVIPTETWDKINALAVNAEPSTENIQIDVTGMSKEHRTKIHDAVKKAFGNAIIGSTVTSDDKKFVKFEKFRKGIRIDTRVKWTWPGDYVHMVVHKRNCDTNEAANFISERLQLNCNIKSSMLGYAGTKDRRAVTSQWFSLRRVDPARIAKACQHIRNVQIGNYTFSDHELKLGMLKGNRFKIALRNVIAEDEVLAKACESLRDRGFINYYGLQRFGTCYKTPTHAVGIKILQGNFREAVDAILEVRPGPMEEALKHYKEYRDPEEAYNLMGFSNRTVEGKLLESLCRDPKDLVGALGRIPRNVRILYAHAYQSYIFNQCASERMRRFGFKPAVGDFVLAHKQDQLHETDLEQGGESDDEDQSEQGAEEKAPEEAKHDADKQTIMNTAHVTANGNGSKMSGSKYEKPPVDVKVLTQEDISSDRYSMLDIILPLPGTDIQYPPNMKDYYQKLVTKDNIKLEMTNKIKTYNLTGVYRSLVVRPLDVAWRSVRFSDPLGDLILSDADHLSGVALDSVLEDGKFKAVILEMSLPSSAYATMALREIMKVDTSGDSQAALNNYADIKIDNKADTEAENKDKEEASEAEKKDTEVEPETKKEDSEAMGEGKVTEAEENKKKEFTEVFMVENTINEPEKRKLEDNQGEPDTKKLKKDE